MCGGRERGRGRIRGIKLIPLISNLKLQQNQVEFTLEGKSSRKCFQNSKSCAQVPLSLSTEHRYRCCCIMLFSHLLITLSVLPAVGYKCAFPWLWFSSLIVKLLPFLGMLLHFSLPLLPFCMMLTMWSTEMCG